MEVTSRYVPDYIMPSPVAVWNAAHDHDLVIEAFGGTGYHVTNPAQLAEALSNAVASGEPSLVDCVLDRSAGAESGHFGSLNPRPLANAVPIQAPRR